MADTFGEELRRLREEAGLKLGELARRVHYSKSHLSNVEGGRRHPTLELAKRCDATLSAGGRLIELIQTDLTSTPTGRAPKPSQLPPSVSYFVGRASAMTQLDSVLATDTTDSAQIVAIDGAPGVGKTALAIRWAHDRVNRFPDGVLYTELHGYRADVRLPQPAHALDEFLRALGVSGHTTPENVTARSALYRSLVDGRRMLIVLDNALSSEQVRPLLPGTSRCLVLVTSRTRLSGLVIREGATRLTVQPLLPGEAQSLLRNILGDDRVDAEPEAARLVAERCAFLPLAVRIAAERAAAHPSGTLAGLAKDLADEDSRLDVLAVGDDDSSALRTIVSWSYNVLPPASALMFRLLSAHPGPDTTAPAAGALVHTSRSVAARTLDHLASVSLLDEHAPDRYRLPPLLHIYAAERLRLDDGPSVRINGIERVLTWYLRTAAMEARALNPHGWHLVPVSPLRPAESVSFNRHQEALSWCDTELHNLMAAIRTAGDEGFDVIAWQLPLTLGIYFDVRKSWWAWIQAHHLGISAARRQGNRVAEAWLLTNLAVAYRDLGRLDQARDFLDESLAIQREAGDQHGETLSLIELGRTLTAQGRLDQAHSRYMTALTILPEIGDDHGEAIALVGMAAVYFAAGQYHLAREPVETALAIFRRLSDRRGEAAALDALGVTYHGIGRREDALLELDRALDAWRDVDDRYGQAITLGHRGGLLRDLGHPAAADSSLRAAWSIFEKLDDPRISSVRARLQDLGSAVAFRTGNA